MGEVEDSSEVLPLARQLRPDVLVLDPWLVQGDLERVIGELAGEGFRVLALGGPEDQVFMTYTLGYGAAGYVTKMQAADALVEGVWTVAGGERGWVSPDVREAVGRRPA